MHKIKCAARREAWADEFNPWGRQTSRSRAEVVDEEAADRVPTNRTESAVQNFTERKRRTQFEGDQPFSPHHASTMPSPTVKEKGDINGGIPSTAAAENTVQTNQATDKGVNEPTAGAAAATATEPIKVRRRNKILHPFRSKNEPPEPPKNRQSSGFFTRDKESYTFKSQIRATLFNSWINVLLVFVPIGIALHYAKIKPVAIFVINFVAIVPLAAMLSYATEEIALRVGETFGGLLNATFGNAVEVIVSVLALVDNQIDIVQESLIGSILSNLLLVLGMSFFLGGVTRIRQHFNLTVAQTASSLLALAVGSLIIPAAFEAYATEPSAGDRLSDVTGLSRGVAVILLLVYAAYLFFQLKTHIEIYNAPSKKVATRKKLREAGKFDEAKGKVAPESPQGASSSSAADFANQHPESPEKGAPSFSEESDDEEHEKPQLSKLTALLTLAISTALVALCAEGMVNSINAITESGGISRTFVGLILLPIVGNAAEHATAVTVACKDKMDLAIGVAVGSSMQVALLVIPLLVILGWILGKEDMNLAFDTFQIIVLFVSILLVNYLIQDGESHWLEGLLLFMLYIIIAVAAFYYPKEGTSGGQPSKMR